MKVFRRRRKVQKGELMNVDVDLISLLFDTMKPANMRSAVIKCEGGRTRKVAASSAKFKSETIGSEGLLYVTVMEPDAVDAQGDRYTAEEVKKAAFNFLKKGVVGKNDVNHNNQPVPEFVIAESYILKSEDKQHFPDTKIGSWVAVLKCEDLSCELWQKVQKGQFNGVSIAGSAEDVDAADNSALVKELRAQIQEIRKALGDKPDAEAQKVVDMLSGRVTELEKQDDAADTQALIKSFTKEIKELSMAMTKAISKSLKGEPDGVKNQDVEVVIDGKKVVVKAAKAEIYKGISDVDGGSAMNILTPNTTGLFIDEVIGSQPGDTLSDITVVPLLKDEKIDAGIVQDLVFKNAADDGTLSAADIATRDISCATGILNAEFTLGRDVVEFYKDKYGEQAFGAYVEQHIARKTEKALRLLLFRGDRASGTAALAGLDGVIKLATTGTAVVEIDSEEHVNWDEKFEAALLGFDDGMLEQTEDFVFYVSHKDLIRLRSEIARRPTAAGDRFLLEGGKLSFAGIPVKARLMPDNYIVAGLPKFIILGYRTDAEMKVEHHGSDWKYHWYIRIRPGITYVPGFVMVFKVV